jgi:predicted nucleic acid-binding protein
MEKAYVLDAYSLICLLELEPGYETMVNLLGELEKGQIKVFVHRATIAEVYYDLVRQGGQEKAENIFDLVKKLSIDVISTLHNQFIRQFGYFKTKHKVSFADCFVLTTAVLQNASVVTTDHHEFDAVEKAGACSFLWLR